MHIMAVLDDRDGMLFNHRRQSRDAALYAHILDLTAGCPLWVHPYSAGLFPPGTVRIDENFLQKAGTGEYAFVENVSPAPFSAEIETIILYRWRRAYPADVYFPMTLLAGRQRIASADLSGNSHEIITEEIYQ